jgi:Tfp pilus assembly protein PilN
MNRPTYEPKEKRARRQFWLKAGVWIILAIFILTSGGLVILGGLR